MSPLAKILVVDDDAEVCEAVAAMLEQGGHQVVRASRGGAALRMCRSQSFDLVITDILMPEVDGLEVLTRLRVERPELRVVALSGGGAFVDRDYCLRMAERLGADEVIEKPVRTGDLLELVARVLARPPRGAVPA